jgi:hypothetical protein
VKRPPALTLICAGILLLWGCHKREFRLSGTVTLASAIQHRIPQTNAVMFIVVKNEGGVPMAMQRIVNPQFPVKFTMGQDDLIVPDVPSSTSLRLEVEMNSHGRLGAPVKGDFAGVLPNSTSPGERRLHVVVDRQL